jgi:hypothetical protein
MPATLHDPIFVLDSRETFQPIAVESVEAVPARIVRKDESDGGDVSLAALPADGGRMDFPRHPEQQEQRLHGKYGGVGYRREVQGGGLTWVQYWLWYLYNPKRMAIVTGDHEGDWEFVQVGYGGDTPVCMTASQHKSGGSRMWWDLEHRQGRPVVYVARGSHANYFAPFEQPSELGDQYDGKGATLDSLAWRDFGSWATWSGRWGNTHAEAESPQSPGSQGDRWSKPHRYHSKSEAQL